MISVVIPAYNEEALIARCLASLAAQSCSVPFEVILVDNGSTDATRAIAERFLGRMNLHILSELRKGRGQARATGWASARGEFLLSLDADAEAPEGWLQSYCDLFRSHPDVAAFTSTGRIYDLGPVRSTIANKAQQPVAVVFRMIFGFHCLNGYNFGIRKDVYRKAGGFNPSMDAQDDLDLARRVSRQGIIRFTTRNPVILSGRRFKRGLLRGAFDYWRTYALAYWLGRKGVLLTDVR